MEKKRRAFAVRLLLMLLCSLAAPLQASLAQSTDPSLRERYLAAIEDAAIVESGEISRDLLRITPDHDILQWNEDKTKLLVVTWKTRDVYERFIKTSTKSPENEERPIWVTAAPQVRVFCRAYMGEHPDATEGELKLRLQQYLGLDPNWSYDLFVEIWVSPEDLFRPCVDPEIDDSRCNQDFGADIPVVKGSTKDSGIEDYRLFYKNLYYKSIRPGAQPWTGLGYTYDWGNSASEVGASEFIIVPGADYAVKEAIPTMDYCRP